MPLQPTVLVAAPYRQKDDPKDDFRVISGDIRNDDPKQSMKNGWLYPLKSSRDWYYSIRLDQPPLHAIRVDDFLVLSKNEVSYFPVPACQAAHVTLWRDPDPTDQRAAATMVEFLVTIASPEYVELRPLSGKGKMTLHSVCGADVALTSATPSDYLSALNELLKQAKAIKDAVDATKPNPAVGAKPPPKH